MTPQSDIVGPQGPITPHPVSVMRTPPYWLVLSSEQLGPIVEGPIVYESELVERMKSLVGTKTHAFVFRGERIHISNGPLRYLLFPSGEPQPLFDTSEHTPDPTGALFDATEPDNAAPDDDSGTRGYT